MKFTREREDLRDSLHDLDDELLTITNNLKVTQDKTTSLTAIMRTAEVCNLHVNEEQQWHLHVFVPSKYLLLLTDIFASLFYLSPHTV